VRREVLALLSRERLIVRERQRAVTPFGGMAVFLEFLQRIDLVGQIRAPMPIRWRSHNRIDPAATVVLINADQIYKLGACRSSPGSVSARYCRPFMRLFSPRCGAVQLCSLKSSRSAINSAFFTAP
jgi:hypothetical protein